MASGFIAGTAPVVVGYEPSAHLPRRTELYCPTKSIRLILRRLPPAVLLILAARRRYSRYRDISYWVVRQVLGRQTAIDNWLDTAVE